MPGSSSADRLVSPSRKRGGTRRSIRSQTFAWGDCAVGSAMQHYLVCGSSQALMLRGVFNHDKTALLVLLLLLLMLARIATVVGGRLAGLLTGSLGA